MQGLDIKTVSLDVIGFSMKAQAGEIEGNIIVVTKELWNEIANRLMQEKSVNVDKIMERLEDLIQPCYSCRESCDEKCLIERIKDIVKEELG